MPYSVPQPAPRPNRAPMNISPPNPFNFEKPETWPVWEERFMTYISFADISRKTSKEKTDLLCYSMGGQSEEILTSILPNAEAKSFEEVLNAFKCYFTPRMNVIALRVEFNSRVQLADESVDSFITALYSLAEPCDFSEQKEDLIRDRIVIGIRDDETSERLQSNSDLTLATAIAEVKQAELQAKELNRNNIPNKKKSSNSNRIQKSNEQNCCLCGLWKHSPGMLCPAKNSRCKKCNGYGHWDKVCKAKTVHNVTEKASSSDNGKKGMRRMNSNSHSSESLCGAAFANCILDDVNVGLKAVAEGSERFSNDFFQVLVNRGFRNLIASPLNARILLAMAAYGACGETASQMHEALYLPRDNHRAQFGFRSLIRTMNAEEGVELSIATKIFIANNFTVNAGYGQLIDKGFLSSIQHVYFDNSRAAAKTINTWCNHRTNKKIPRIVSEGTLRPDTALVLVNALYFKGQWKSPFLGDPKHRPFYIDPTTIRVIPMMSNTDRFRMGNLPKLDAEFIEIPYKGDRLSMIIILPNSITGLEGVQGNLYLVNLEQSLQRADYRHVLLSVPKFKIISALNLGPILEELGMTRMFQAAADFSRITGVPLNITHALQTAFIEVDETGMEGAARMSPTEGLDPERQFTVNRPFYFSIYHNPTGISLFTGIVQVPDWE